MSGLTVDVGLISGLFVDVGLISGLFVGVGLILGLLVGVGLILGLFVGVGLIRFVRRCWLNDPKSLGFVHVTLVKFSPFPYLVF